MAHSLRGQSECVIYILLKEISSFSNLYLLYHYIFSFYFLSTIMGAAILLEL